MCKTARATVTQGSCTSDQCKRALFYLFSCYVRPVAIEYEIKVVPLLRTEHHEFNAKFKYFAVAFFLPHLTTFPNFRTVRGNN